MDISHNHGRGPRIIEGRESHTVDLEEFDHYVERLRQLPRHRDSPAMCGPFWEYARSILEKAERVGFEELPDPEAVVQKGPRESAAFLKKLESIDSVNPIHPAFIAEQGGFPRDVVLTECLYATRVGLVSMHWAPRCLRCGVAVTMEECLGCLPEEHRCEACHFDNDIHILDTVMVVFFLNPDVLYMLVDNPFYCRPGKVAMESNVVGAIVPATSTGSGFRYSVGTDDQMMIAPSLSPGRYKMYCTVSRTRAFLDVQSHATHKDSPIVLRIHVSDIVVRSPVDKIKVIELPHGKIHFDVIPDTHSLFALWIYRDVSDNVIFGLPEDERNSYTSATHVLHQSAFQNLFPDQVVRGDTYRSLTIRSIVVVFTDIVNSTQLYTTIGDGPALKLVRKHYEVIFRAFVKAGRVVKTIGDAVMASFTSGTLAIEAVAEIMTKMSVYCRWPDGKPLQIRVGMHGGSTHVVPLNGINDYFGLTVNIASRVEAAAGPSECRITDTVLTSDSNAAAAFHSLFQVDKEGIAGFEALSEKALVLKGVPGLVKTQGFRLCESKKKAKLF